MTCSPVGGVAVAHVGLPEAVEADHRGHGQVTRNQGHQQAAVLGRSKVRICILLCSVALTHSHSVLPLICLH